MISETHPYWHVRGIVERHPEIVAIPLSYYTYVPQTVAESRSQLLVPAEDFVQADLIASIIAATPSGQELAIHSDLRMRSGLRVHLLMVDMSTGAKAHLEKLRSFLGVETFERIAWFSSGRSFHGYGEDLLAEQEWVKFMGLLLLANKPRMEPTVDPRWIGHRLYAGYSALRWTRNTEHYLTSPTALRRHPLVDGTSRQVGALGKSLRKG